MEKSKHSLINSATYHRMKRIVVLIDWEKVLLINYIHGLKYKLMARYKTSRYLDQKFGMIFSYGLIQGGARGGGGYKSTLINQE